MRGRQRPGRSGTVTTAIVAVLVGAGVALGGCRGASDTEALDDQSGTTVTCLVHQTREPSSDYTGGTHADTRRVLRLLRYYTANGRKPYCDRKPGGERDRHWASLYVRLGADPSNVQTILNGS